MVLIQRDNFDSRCIILERNITREELSTYLEILKEQYEAQGWQTVWDDERIKYSLTLYRNEFECISFLPYFRRIPSRKDWFVW